MRTIYLDENFMCYTQNATGRTAIQTAAFDGKCGQYICGYRFIPQGKSWTRGDGAVFEGEMICPAVDQNQLDAAQRVDEYLALESLGAFGAAPPSDMAAEIRDAMNVAVAALPDNAVIACAAILFPWDASETYNAGDVRQYNGLFYRCLEGHTAQLDWTPDVAVSLWTQIADSKEAWPAWTLPGGAHNAYEEGAKVSHNGTNWKSTTSGNVWEPGVYGWSAAN